MTNAEIIQRMVTKVSRKIEHRMNNLGENYAEAKEKVKPETCAGVSVWEVLDRKYS